MLNLKVGIIGLSMGLVHARALVNCDHATVYAICDTNAELLASASKELGVTRAFTDYRDLLAIPELDAVLIVAPDQLHREMVEAAVAADKHILCEKPLALTREDITAIVDVAHKSKKKFMVGQICRYTPGFLAAKKLIDAGEIGELTFVESEYAHDYHHILTGVHSWRADPLRNGVVGGGCHAVDLLRWIAGNPEVVTAYGVHKTMKDLTPYDDTHVAIMKFPNGVIGKVFISISCKRDYTMRSVFYGTKGTIITDNTSPSMKIFRILPEDEGKNEAEIIPIDVNNHNTLGEFEEFYDCIVSDRPIQTTAMEGANTVAVCHAIVESANTLTSVVPKYFD